MPSFKDRLMHAWNAFNGRDRPSRMKDLGPPTYTRSDAPRRKLGNERSIVTAIYNRIAVDVSQVSIRHVRLDVNGMFLEDIRDGLNNVLTTEANIDQTGRAFIRDLSMSMLEEGYIAAVPVDTTLDPLATGGYDIDTIRRGRIKEWRPKHVLVEVYNDKTGHREDLLMPKKMVAIVENPFYAIMNEPNSTLQRLIRKLNILDAIDEQSGSGKLDMIIQLPYVIKTQSRRDEAEKRRADIERQLSGSKLGIAYTDGTERVIQLNRPLENNLMSQIEYLTKMLYSQLGITESILDGSADEQTRLNYYTCTVEPILDAIKDEFERKFLTKTARTRGEAIRYFRSPFKLTPVVDLANIADALTRNAILSSNEMRGVLGYKPSDEPDADRLMNKNMNPYDAQGEGIPPGEQMNYPEEEQPYA